MQLSRLSRIYLDARKTFAVMFDVKGLGAFPKFVDYTQSKRKFIVERREQGTSAFYWGPKKQIGLIKSYPNDNYVKALFIHELRHWYQNMKMDQQGYVKLNCTRFGIPYSKKVKGDYSTQYHNHFEGVKRYEDNVFEQDANWAMNCI